MRPVERGAAPKIYAKYQDAGPATYTNKAAWKAQNKEKTNERG